MSVEMIVLSLIVFVVLLFVGVDVVVGLHEWSSRIHIGRWNDRGKWKMAIEKRAKLWLRHTPVVRRTAQSRLVLLDMLTGKYRSFAIQTWQVAGLLLGVDEVSAREYVQSHQQLLTLKEVFPEDFLLAYSLKKYGLLTPEQEKKVLSSCQALKEDGTIYYRPWVKNLRFVDTLGMVLPFLHACGWDDLAMRQLQEYDAALLYGLYPAHAYDVEKGLPLGVYDWGRGMGWYVLALTETSDMPGNDERIERLAEAMLKHQRMDGGFSCFVFNQRERMESSGTALMGLLFITAYSLTNDQRFLVAAQRVEKALMKVTRRNGALDDCQGDTYGIGYYSQRFSVMPFAQGMALLLSKKLDEFVDENP